MVCGITCAYQKMVRGSRERRGGIKQRKERREREQIEETRERVERRRPERGRTNKWRCRGEGRQRQDRAERCMRKRGE